MEPSSQSLITARLQDCTAVLESLRTDSNYLEIVTKVADKITAALGSGHKVLFFGNGGSAADAQHLAAEFSGRYLRERCSLAGLALTTNTSVLTAIGNDYSFENIFARQIEGIGAAGDVAFGISTSGNSANVICAMEAARRKKLITVGLTGQHGGKLRAVAEYCICIPSQETPRIQEAHILTGHILCELVEQAVFQGPEDS
jgi:D-sedoheptulose 7-phosphate isomerase